MKFLAFVTFIIGYPDSEPFFQITTTEPVECRSFGEQIAQRFEDEGFTVDYLCYHTNAPVRSMRPVARPVRVEL